jgi:uncharacterized protein (TIGR02145 family)
MKNIVKISGLILLILSINLLNSCKKDKPTIPVITTAEVTGISTSTAVSGGIITDEGGAAVTSRGVCWNTTDNPVIDNNKSSETGGSGSFTSNISQLTTNTTYYVRAYATNIAGTGYGNSKTFKTLGDKPASAAVGATEITTNSATLSGKVNANSLTTKVSFEYGLNINYGNSIDATQSPISGDSNGSLIVVSVAVTGLNPGSIYNFRIKAENSLGITYSDNMNFTTLGGLSTASVQAATNIYLNNAVLNGLINPNYLSTTVAFQWGLTTSYGNYIEIPQGPFTGHTSIPVNYEITGLSVGTTYHFRIEAVNWWGTSYSDDLTFKTLGQVPTAVPQQAFDIQYISATLPGTVNPNLLSTTVSFEYGTTTSYGTTLGALPSPITGNNPVNVSVGLYGLTSGTTYHYRIKATNELGTTMSDDMIFTSLAPITDIDGNNYNIKTLGTQVWMTENLKTTKYRNGDIIGTTATPFTDVSSETTPKYQWAYNGDESNAAIYGRLYTWHVLDDVRGVCPAGWHVPSDAEWTKLTDYLISNGYGYGGSGVNIGKSLATTWGWNTDPTPGNVGNDQASNNTSGFNAAPSGIREPDSYLFLGSTTGWWSTTLNEVIWAGTLNIGYSYAILGEGYMQKYLGYSIRCLKN